ncbi:MAG: hypothetical protein J2P43_01545 [Candidatus Dormibacteraeota bacterium]|nr:hypothetical protein [Candidatus Dormibacteraeota bacterium]
MADTNGSMTAPAVREVELDLADFTQRFTPRELRLIKEHTGRSFSEILSDDESDDRFTVLAWLKARRDGQGIEWEDMDDVVIVLANSAVDPTTVLRDAISQPSAATGA